MARLKSKPLSKSDKPVGKVWILVLPLKSTPNFVEIFSSLKDQLISHTCEGVGRSKKIYRFIKDSQNSNFIKKNFCSKRVPLFVATSESSGKASVILSRKKNLDTNIYICMHVYTQIQNKYVYIYISI